MKFNFKIQQYQTDAVDSVVNCFNGQPYIDNVSYRRDIGNVRQMKDMSQIDLKFDSEQNAFGLTDDFDESGFKNENLLISPDMVLSNIKEVQQNNNVMVSDSLVGSMGACSLDVEMETGTGKTYVYIKTMFELNKRYGWSKFIVVVPSIAIREGVKKSFEITQDHFMEHYGKKARFFVYNSSNLNQLDSFSSNAGINVMIINMQAFNTSMKEGGRSKEARIIYDKRDEFGSRRPIDVIKANNPIIILDEPQKMGGDATQKALKNFNPLFTLNYSATHAKHHNLVYALDAVDAYNQHLVKKIEVKGFQVKNFRGRTVNIDHQLQRTSDMRYIIETTKTDAGTRVLPITEDVAQMFQAIIEDRNAPKVEKSIDGYSGFLFYDDNGMPLVAMHWQHRFNHMVGRYNDIYRVQMPNITPHVCRHTYCSNMAKSGMNPKTLQYLMGHSDISVTMNVYTHIGFDDAEEELKRMEEFRKAQAEVEQKKEKPMSQKMFKVV